MAYDSHPLARAVVLLARRLRQERDSGLTPNQMSVLGALATNGPMTPGEIAQREQVRPPSITRIVSCLADDGLVTRQDHPEDGRQVMIAISAQGIAQLEHERERRDLWLAERLAALTDAERKTLNEAAELLERVARS